MEPKMLLEQIKALFAEQKTVMLADFEKAGADEREKIMAQVDALDTRMQLMEKALVPNKISLPGVTEEKEKFSFFKAIKAIRFNDWSEAGFEQEVFQQTKKRAMSYGSTSAGGYLVPYEQILELIEYLRAESVVIQSGATVLGDLSGAPVTIPKQTGGATGYWVGENAAITSSDLTVGQLSLTPKKVGALVKLSNTLLKLSNPSAEALVRRDIALTIALQIDLKALRGTGTSNEPTGIANQSGINTVAIGTNGGNVDFDDLIDMEYELANDNALRGSLGYIFHPTIRRKLLKLKVAQYSGDTGGDYIVAPVTEQVLQNWIGYPYKMTTQIPVNLTKGEGTSLTEIYFGNWQELIIGQWGGMEIMASMETSDAFEKDQTWVRCLQEVDIAVRHAESFCLISDANAT